MARPSIVDSLTVKRCALISFFCAIVIALFVSLEAGILAKTQEEAHKSHGKSAPVPPQFAGMKLPEGILFFDNEGQDHVEPGTHATYKTDPPTSGPHYQKWAAPGVYEAGAVQPELLVHNLEHGNIVIYFDRSVLSKVEMDELIALPKKYAEQWDGVLLVGIKNKEKPLILTAWRAMLPLKGYDKEKILGFLEIFRGRGPEKVVR